MTSGTNGCNTNARLGYGGRSIFAMNGMLDNIAEDMAKGQGEALDAYAVLLGVEARTGRTSPRSPSSISARSSRARMRRANRS